MVYKYLFGPVLSRRLGISLGLDLVPHKVCSLNCIYCEVGKTTLLTAERKEYVPVKHVIPELRDYLSQKPKLDYITFSGAGEPTLNSGIGEIISFLKTEFSEYKIALLTNGILFSSRRIRNEIIDVDLILPSLDAASEIVFQKINRPVEGVNVNDVIKGLVDLRKEFSGEIWLEIFLVPDINDTKQELTLLKSAVTRINPDKVQLNSLDRPGTEPWIESINREKIVQIAEFFKPLPVEIITQPKQKNKAENFNQNITEQILETIRRRPCTADDLEAILALNTIDLNRYLNILLEKGKIETIKQERGYFFRTT
ncbi:MAG: radical SAM protein [Candidatus Cloacimonas sp. SDB]|nr:MAG: radical SAM protein [Candidatus Cloacimonas sp. SDB]